MSTMSSESRLLKANGLPPQHPEFWSNIHAPPPPTPAVIFAQILVTTGSSAPCMSVLPVGRLHWVMQHIIVWQPSVISVIDGDIPTMSAIFGSVEDATPQGMWSITAQSICSPSQMFAALIGGPIPTTTTSTPLWMTTREIRHMYQAWGSSVQRG